MGACLSKQQSPEPSGEPPERAAATQPLEIKAEPDQSQTAASDYASVQSADRDSSFASSTADYAGAPAPVCEINRRQHLLDLNIMHTVGAVGSRFLNSLNLAVLRLRISDLRRHLNPDLMTSQSWQAWCSRLVIPAVEHGRVDLEHKKTSFVELHQHNCRIFSPAL
jgi:hypothetical protein